MKQEEKQYLIEQARIFGQPKSGRFIWNYQVWVKGKQCTI